MTTPDERETDALLAAMLAPPARTGDRGFAVGVERAIDARAVCVLMVRLRACR